MTMFHCRYTSILWVDKNNAIHALPIKIKVERGEMCRPENYLFVHEKAHYTICEQDGRKYVRVETNDQDIVVNACDIVTIHSDLFKTVEATFYKCGFEVELYDPTVALIIADPSGAVDKMTRFFNMRFEFSETFDPSCFSCEMHKKQAETILEFLNHAVIIPKDAHRDDRARFVQKNLKRAIYIMDTSSESILKWFVQTFSITFSRAKIKNVILEDLREDVMYIEAVPIDQE